MSEERKQFIPEVELKRVREAPKGQRAELLEEFKEKLASQRERLAEMQEVIIARVREEPDLDLKKVSCLVDALSRAYGFTEDQKTMALGLFVAYVEKHKSVRAARDKYLEDRDLFNAVFGRYPRGEVKIIEGPMTLYFQCHDLDDYALIHSQAFLDNKEDASEEQKKEADKTIGVSIASSLIPKLNGTIIAENSAKIEKLGRGHKMIIDHEEQHAIKKLFGDKMQELNGWETVSKAKTDEERLLAIRGWLRFQREYLADEKARDEILAFFIEGNPTLNIVNILSAPKKEGGLYDYLVEEGPKLTEFLVRKFGPEFEPVVIREVERIFTKEYHELLRIAVNALGRLSRAGYSSSQAMADTYTGAPRALGEGGG